ncbi:hypothetical protein JTE90_025856 [Oedothorax gibbosus]|uniref:Uncharacterized protein n=1 Tax=Oedothorax gibbosus TaxID=931172 RepID=A0AAV6UNJ9_9ARAC|nr:hypothetical protein JTE90_025856 [Oedothorax gibbosus]
MAAPTHSEILSKAQRWQHHQHSELLSKLKDGSTTHSEIHSKMAAPTTFRDSFKSSKMAASTTFRASFKSSKMAAPTHSEIFQKLRWITAHNNIHALLSKA